MHRTLNSRQRALRGLFLLVLLITVPNIASGQVGRNMEVGRMRFSTNEAMTSDNIAWPWRFGYSGLNDDVMNQHTITIGVKRTWTDKAGATHDYQVAQIGQNKTTDFMNIVVPIAGEFWRKHRNPYPTKELDSKDWSRKFDVEDAIDPNLVADVIVHNKMKLYPKFGMDMSLERYVYQWGSPKMENFLVEEWIVRNDNPTEKRQDVYVGIFNSMGTGDHYPGWLWGNTLRGQEAGGADSLTLYYAWRGHRTATNPKQDNAYDADGTWGHFKKPQYTGMLLLHADPLDGGGSPLHKLGWSGREYAPDLVQFPPRYVYEYLSQPWATLAGDGRYAEYDATRYFRRLTAGFDMHKNDPDAEQEKSGLMSFGPYQLDPGEEVRVVVAYVGGAIPPRLAIDAGRAYLNGFDTQASRGTVPLPYNRAPFGPDYVMYDLNGYPIVQNGNVIDYYANPSSPPVLATGGEKLNQGVKDQILDLGRKIMLMNASRVKQMWQASSISRGGGTIPDPWNKLVYAPASPSLKGFSKPDFVRLEWSDNQTPEDKARAGEIVKWRIYREYKRPPGLVLPHDTTFLLLKELDKATTAYDDKDAIRGTEYYYYVVGVTAAGIESSQNQARTGTAATKSNEALIPRQPPVTDNWQDQVVVVPNPYHVRGSGNYGGKRLNFLNLPPYANIHIYTVVGERVATIEHNVEAGDEDWDRQETRSMMEIVSGVYLYVVEELDAPNGSPTGAKAVGKFVVIK